MPARDDLTLETYLAGLDLLSARRYARRGS